MDLSDYKQCAFDINICKYKFLKTENSNCVNFEKNTKLVWINHVTY